MNLRPRLLRRAIYSRRFRSAHLQTLSPMESSFGIPFLSITCNTRCQLLYLQFLESPYWCPKSSWVAFDFPCSSCTKCKQCKIRAVKVKDDLQSVISGINVLVNPEKPRRGCFEVREEGGKKFDMK
ncbi:uncharacterized protein LOC110937357 isoform X2 [Helianthus annuus]|uniref:uncharacterized protein LOC110937357 isoform X2 n=1 Tax=Helianthus annuus TaxID=4232 RepID=UPI000B8F1406|nr:uncharacterized protein LOC110937357 isoform X2 [Helianthus annuus]